MEEEKIEQFIDGKLENPNLKLTSGTVTNSCLQTIKCWVPKLHINACSLINKISDLEFVTVTEEIPIYYYIIYYYLLLIQLSSVILKELVILANKNIFMAEWLHFSDKE